MSLHRVFEVALVGVVALPLLAPAQEGKDAPQEPPAPPPEGQDAGPKAGELPEPEFKAAKGAEAFRKARELLEAENYRDSLAEMKKLKEQGKTPDDRDLIQRWTLACEGGLQLDGYRKLVERGNLRQTFFMALDAFERYRGTPIAPKLSAFVDETRGRVLEVLESFDVAGARYTEKYGKRFIKDPAIVFRGAHCLLWESVKGARGGSQLKLPSAPARWTPYHSVVFWIRCERPVDLQLLALCPGSSSDQETSAMEAVYTPPVRPGWTRAEVRLDEFKRRGGGSFAKVDSFLLQIQGGTAFKFYIDEIALVRKDAAAAGAAPEPEKKDQKKSTKKKKK